MDIFTNSTPNLLDFVFKFSLSLLFSGLIGYEREMNESSAGIKTHIIVGVSSTMIAIVQLLLTQQIYHQNLAMGDITTGLGSDPTRLIAQVISGIGFLGTGTIIVTKRHVSGLTTAASIWTVAIIGITLGMGMYPLAIIGFLFIISTLFIFKRVIKVKKTEKVTIKYLKKSETSEKVMTALLKVDEQAEIIGYDSKFYGDELVAIMTFRITSSNFDFDEFIRYITTIENIISVDSTNV
ncbi:MgtC/SapB family protein [Erysipelothrix urinaevulpis]|uniref:MgtC/SapB family protein n=1 Tax=Erysipelothrix urinaevulpis TaxID=2683717 RepID=UPI00135B4EB1|nr:MgtC/SapB family protein [Erysipelothrix urinaevulpis]